MRPQAVRRPIWASTEQSQRRHKPDYWILIISAVLLTLGLIVIYAISPGLAVQHHVGQNYYVNKQLIALVLSIIIFALMAKLPLQTLRQLQKPLLVVAFIATLVALVLPVSLDYPAHRWIRFAGLSLQSVEFVKFAILIWLASFLSDRMREGKTADTKATLKPVLIALAILGLLVAKLQSDLGSTGVMVIMMAVMVFVAGMPIRRVLMICAIVAAMTVLAVSTTAYRRDRLMTFLQPTRDCQNQGYQACQALIAVGSGGMFGLGVGNSVQAFGYLPESENDSIFAIYSEKFGFIGTALLLVLFATLFSRIRAIAERAPDDFSRLIVIGILTWLSVQAFINVGAMIGLLPLKGITLPFISYGGTSMLFVAAALGIVFQVSRYTSYGTTTQGSRIERTHYDHSTGRGRDRRAHYAAVSRRP